MAGSKYKASVFNFIFNSFNSVIVIINGIIMVPLYFEYISLATYGAWLGSGNVVSMLGLLEAGFASVITQKMSAAKAKSNNVLLQKLAGANILSAIVISIGIILLGLALSPFIAHWVNTPEASVSEITQSFIIAVVAAGIAILVSLFGAFPQVWQDTKAVGAISIVANILAILSLVAFLLLGAGVKSIPLSYLVRSCTNLICQGLWIIRKWEFHNMSRPIFDMKTVWDVLRNCILPFISKASGSIMTHSQSFLISAFVSPTMSAIYDLTSKITTCVCSFLSSINGSFFALFALTLGKDNKQEADEVFKNVSKFFTLALVAALFFSLSFTKPIMNYWVGLAKYGGMGLLVLIVFSSLFNQNKSFFNNLLYCGGFINRSAKYDIYCMVAYLAILAVSIHHLDVYAIPVSLIISNAFFMAFYLRLLNRSLKLDSGGVMKFMAKTIGITTIFAIPTVGINILSDNIPLIMAVCACIFALYIIFHLYKDEQLKTFVFSILWKRKTSL